MLISVSQLHKSYKTYANKWMRLIEWLTWDKFLLHKEKAVLKDISFSVQRGESLAIVGKNGAGKSTLLKILTGASRATSGSYYVGGRISALLELGMGFHPDFTGRENIYMAGQILGFSTEEIREQMPNIEAFAEIGSYFDRPVRIYSSGMQVRLAFSIATAIRPDILIVDEALSVGDAYFQHKCFERIKEFKKQGTTLLFVSHDPGAIVNLCDRAVLISDGKIIKDGDPEFVLNYYNAMIAQAEKESNIRELENLQGRKTIRSGNQKVKIEKIDLFASGKSARVINSGEAVKVQIDFRALQDIKNLTCGILIKDRIGNEIYGTNTHHKKLPIQNLELNKNYTFEFYFPEFNLGVGNFKITLALHEEESHISNNFDWWDEALTFEVTTQEKQDFIGVNRLRVEPKLL